MTSLPSCQHTTTAMETSPGYQYWDPPSRPRGPIVAPDNNKDGSWGWIMLSARLTSLCRGFVPLLPTRKVPPRHVGGNRKQEGSPRREPRLDTPVSPTN